MEIKLTQGKIAVIDDKDYKIISKYNWHAVKKGKTYYAYTHPKKYEDPIAMHRLIMNPPVNMIIDHKDCNGLNNKRSNLRTCTHSQNKANLDNYLNNNSGFRGVSWDKSRNKWRACLRHNDKHINLGRFNSKEEAAQAYDLKAIEIFGKEFIRLNKYKKGGKTKQTWQS